MKITLFENRGAYTDREYITYSDRPNGRADTSEKITLDIPRNLNPYWNGHTPYINPINAFDPPLDLIHAIRNDHGKPIVFYIDRDGEPVEIPLNIVT